MAVSPLTPNDWGDGARAVINVAIAALNAALDRLAAVEAAQGALNIDGLRRDVADAADRVARNAAAVARLGTDAQADRRDAAAERAATAAALGDLGRMLDVVQAAVRLLGDPAALPRLVGQRFDFLAAAARPGDSPAAFVLVSSRASLAGDCHGMPEISATAIAGGDFGRELRISGAGIVAQREAAPIETGRIYRCRYVVQRRANPSDPSGDSVEVGIVWLDAGMNVIPDPDGVRVVEDIRDLSTAFGRQERQATFSLSPSADAQFRTPPRARYARPYVRFYGLDGSTAVQVLGIDDISLATVLAPETASTVDRVSALESENAGQRLSVLEANANAPNSVTFPTKSDAARGAIPGTVTTVELRGATTAGDGGGGLYKRISGAAPPGSDSFTNQGVSFARVFSTSEVLGAELSSLPTTLPPVAGRAWLNGGVLAVS